VQAKVVQGVILGAALVAAAILVVSNATGWADWVVFGVIVVTTYGFAVAIAPNVYARRKRTISRSGGGGDAKQPPVA
jgi:hypothetical protein